MGGINFDNTPKAAPVVPQLKKASINRTNSHMRRATLQPFKAKKNWYNILGVPKHATHEDIEAQYHKLAQQYKGVDEETFQSITKAYNILVDDELRELYHDGDLDAF